MTEALLAAMRAGASSSRHRASLRDKVVDGSST